MKQPWMLLPIVVSTLSCATGAVSSAFIGDPSGAVHQMRVMAVAPITVTADVAISDTIIAQVDSLVVATLRTVGVQVVPASAYEQLWDEVYEESVPIFDPHTGRRNEESYQAAWSTFYSKLAAQYDAYVVLFPEVWEVLADVRDGYAQWDGASQNMASTGSHVLAILSALVPDNEGQNGFLPTGSVEALSLNLLVEDSSGSALYSQRAGIESLRSRMTSDRRSGSEVLQDAERIAEAVQRALEPLLQEFRRQAEEAPTYHE